MIKQSFFSRLPSNVQAIFAQSIEVSSVDQLASSANKMLEYTRYKVTGDRDAAVSSSSSPAVALLDPELMQAANLQASRAN